MQTVQNVPYEIQESAAHIPTPTELATKQIKAIENRVYNNHKPAFFDFDYAVPEKGSINILLSISDKEVVQIISEPQAGDISKKLFKERESLKKNSEYIVKVKKEHDDSLANMDYVKATAAGQRWKQYERAIENGKLIIADLELKQVQEMKQYIENLESFENQIKEFLLSEIAGKKKEAMAKLKEMEKTIKQ